MTERDIIDTAVNSLQTFAFSLLVVELGEQGAKLVPCYARHRISSAKPWAIIIEGPNGNRAICLGYSAYMAMSRFVKFGLPLAPEWKERVKG